MVPLTTLCLLLFTKSGFFGVEWNIREKEGGKMGGFSVLHLPNQPVFDYYTKALMGQPTVLCRTQLMPSKLSFCCQSQSVTVKYELDCLSDPSAFSPSLLAAEREEAKAVLSLFLQKRGLSHKTTSRAIKKSDQFINHLVSRLHSVHRSRYLIGRELTTLEIREALIPYLESLLEEHCDLLQNIVQKLPHEPEREITLPYMSAPKSVNMRKLRAIYKVSNLGPDGKLPCQVYYLLDFGFSHDQIKDMVRRFPAFAYYSLDGKIKPLIKFLIELGVPISDVPNIIYKRPQLCGISLPDNVLPTMTYLESFGFDKSQWAKVIHRFPALLTYSRQKIKACVDYFAELGLSEEAIGKLLTRCPQIVSYSVEGNLRPTSQYFISLGISPSVLIQRAPNALGLSIEAHLKPVTDFFLDKGFEMCEVIIMLSRFGTLYTFSLGDNIRPKWEFFLTMGYAKCELVKFPQYFGYSLEKRIKPRYARMISCGVRLLLNQVLSTTILKFELLIEKKSKKIAGCLDIEAAVKGLSID